MADETDEKMIDLTNREDKIEWLRAHGVGEDEIAFMFAVEDGEIEGDIQISEEDEI